MLTTIRLSQLSNCSSPAGVSRPVCKRQHQAFVWDFTTFRRDCQSRLIGTSIVPGWRWLKFGIENPGKRLEDLQDGRMIAGIVSILRLTAHFDDAGMMQAGQVLAERRLRYSKLLGQAVYILLTAGQMNTDLKAFGI
ncbi:hypothetical protein GGD54_002828 [Rhizobium tropici]|uniref:Transposase n=1 Tax=Rhizobium tropici TaxID=398 RepID=A0ABR6QZS1_RHITR|nr:hypothetical protein [Rhizobium tropici]MBB5593877.1 hypothetical protein [Rhizobium tropici]MBB6492423.1 hypothetical protein [Rhizobium tropici]